jgi:hypothetical protein
MKTTRLLFSLASLSLTVIGARAASLDATSEAVHLPAYAVEVPRLTEAERQVARSLNELRAAHAPLAIETEIPLVSARKQNGDASVKPAKSLIVAKS